MAKSGSAMRLRIIASSSPETLAEIEFDLWAGRFTVSV